MTKAKKLVAAFVVAAIAAMFAIGTAFAAGTGTITISNANKGETYSVYKVFDANGNGTSIRYTVIDGKTAALPTGFSKDAAGNVTHDGEATELTAAEIAAIKEYVGTDAAIATVPADADGNLTIGGLENGYYYITTTTGTVVTINSTNPNATVIDKNPEPSIEKEVVSTDANAQVGTDVDYTLTVTAQKGAKNYVVHDKMSAGLTFNNDVEIADVADTNYSVVSSDLTDGCTFHIVFNQSYLDTINAATPLVITYSAKVNENAVVGANTNDSKLTYGNAGEATSETKTVTTTPFDMKKTDGTNVLSGAKFKLYDAKTGGNEIVLIKDGDFYRPIVAGETGEEIEAGTATVKGLDADTTYYLEETVAPDGYNMLTERFEVTLNGDNNVINQAGATLPTTGGMGTTIIYIIGALMVAGAVVVLIARRRVRE